MSRVLVTGVNGYIGGVLVPALTRSGHDVIGLDTGYFESCTFGGAPPEVDVIRMDVRDVRPADLPQCDAVIHLAALSNDALGAFSPETTREVNATATLHLARIARDAGVRRFLFASSCSLYGAAETDDYLTESAPFNPVTAYGRSKVEAEAGLAELADDEFSPVYLRNATAYGASPRLRGDIVVNELVARAALDGEVRLNSDGRAWRPLVHVQDIARAFVAMLEAPRERVHNRAFNVGSTTANYSIREIAEAVVESVPGSRVTFGEGAGADLRSYRVSFARLSEELPDAAPQWTLRDGILQLLDAYRAYETSLEDVLRTRYSRIAWLRGEQAAGELDETLRWSGRTRERVAS